jgi:hypothetical protein
MAAHGTEDNADMETLEAAATCDMYSSRDFGYGVYTITLAVLCV